jgi:cellulose synthase/poly-beta-1,6-N-acetylglucosamine synthase-like glycosyltransferase
VRSLLNQDYPKELYEVIVADDHSEDRTFDVVQQVILSQEIVSPDLIALRLADADRSGVKTLSFKKRAIEFGIKNSSGDLIITTDADCIAGKKWLLTLAGYYEQFRPKMIAGPVAFSREKTWLEKWQSLDLCGLMAITAGAITNKFPNMCNGANLAYEKKAFETVQGFLGIERQPGGDDIMLMMKINRQYPGSVHFLKSRDAITSTNPEETMSGLLQQRVRWLSKGTAFPDWRVSVTLVFAWVFNVSILVNLVGGFFFRDMLMLAGLAFAVKTLVELPVLWSGSVFFGKLNLLRYVLPAQVMHILYVIVVGSASRFYRYSWKGRR